MELDEATYKRITDLSESGNQYMDSGEWDKAIDQFDQALQLVPEPKAIWEASEWLYASIGDAYFNKAQFEESRDAFLDAINCSDGDVNPFISLRLGESYFELGVLDLAKEHLLRAFATEGREIFSEEPPKYLDFLEESIDLGKRDR